MAHLAEAMAFLAEDPTVRTMTGILTTLVCGTAAFGKMTCTPTPDTQNHRWLPSRDAHSYKRKWEVWSLKYSLVWIAVSCFWHPSILHAWRCCNFRVVVFCELSVSLSAYCPQHSGFWIDRSFQVVWVFHSVDISGTLVTGACQSNCCCCCSGVVASLCVRVYVVGARHVGSSTRTATVSLSTFHGRGPHSSSWTIQSESKHLDWHFYVHWKLLVKKSAESTAAVAF